MKRKENQQLQPPWVSAINGIQSLVVVLIVLLPMINDAAKVNQAE